MIATLPFNISLLSPAFLHRVRATGRDDQDQPVVRGVAAGGEPLRDLLRRARPGEEIILASHCPFSRPGPFREFGPIHVSAGGGQPEREWIFTRRAEPALDYFEGRLTLRAYRHDGAIGDAALVDFAAVPRQLEEFLARAEIAFVDARFPTCGYFAARFR